MGMVFNLIDQVLRIYLIFQYKDYFTAIPETMMICIENKEEKTQVALRERDLSVLGMMVVLQLVISMILINLNT